MASSCELKSRCTTRFLDFRWRHFGAKYVDMHADYTGQGVDQLAECIRKIKEDPSVPNSKISLHKYLFWNPF